MCDNYRSACIQKLDKRKLDPDAFRARVAQEVDTSTRRNDLTTPEPAVWAKIATPSSMASCGFEAST